MARKAYFAKHKAGWAKHKKNFDNSNFNKVERKAGKLDIKNKLDEIDNVITVVAALIEKDNKVLIAKRSTGDSSNLNKWEFPGGKVEHGESEAHAIEREIKEEFELDVKAKKFLINNICEYPTKTVDLRLYYCVYKNGEFKLHDHSEYKFIAKDDLLKYDLCEADKPLAKYVTENI